MKTGAAGRQSPPRRVPQRTCIACRQVNPKRELVRVVRTPGGVLVDEKGKTSGRGAYVCKAEPCWNDALKDNRLARVLRTTILPADRQRLEEFRDRLFKGVHGDEHRETG